MKTEHRFAVPCNGYYNVSLEIYSYIPTGKYETVPSGRKWWQFWKPKTKQQEIMVRMPVDKTTGIVKFNAGDTVVTSVITRLHGDHYFYV